MVSRLTDRPDCLFLPTGQANGSACAGIGICPGIRPESGPDTSKVVTARRPSPDEWAALQFAWRIVKHVKHNAIVYARKGQLIAAGAWQMSRVDSVKFAASKAILPLEGCVVANDAFFPFPDGLEAAYANGARAFIQPGGSVKDPEVIEAANRLGAAMVFTGLRHFRH